MLYRTALGIVLKDLRTEQELRMREVANKAYISYGYLSEIERGKKEVTSGVMYWLCEALGTNVPDVLDRVSTLMRDTELSNEVKDLLDLIKGDKWEAKRGNSGSDEQYAVLAKLFVVLQEYEKDKALVRCADVLEVPYETLKTRLRTAKSKGFLIPQGMGVTSSQITDKAIIAIEERVTV